MAVASGSSAARAPKRGRRRSSSRARETRAAWLFLLPSALHFAVFTVGALIASLVISTWQWNLITPHTFVGLGNYTALFSDPQFFQSLLVTLIYSAITIPVGLAAGLVLALALTQKLRGMAAFRFIYFIPYVAPIAAAALLWRWMYNSEFGILNWMLSALLPGEVQIDWLGEPRLALVAVAVMDIWKNLGWSVTLFTAGLLAIPNHYYEAATLDGASAWQRFRHITFPLLSSTTFFLVVTGFIGSFQVFDSIYLMIGDTPGGESKTFNFYIWEQGFRYANMGYASALSWVLFLLIGLLTFVQFRFINKRVNYDLG
jgi:multiple sugar transport system permease protein